MRYMISSPFTIEMRDQSNNKEGKIHFSTYKKRRGVISNLLHTPKL